MARSCGRDCLCRQERGLVTLDTGRDIVLAPPPEPEPEPDPKPCTCNTCPSCGGTR